LGSKLAHRNFGLCLMDHPADPGRVW